MRVWKCRISLKTHPHLFGWGVLGWDCVSTLLLRGRIANKGFSFPSLLHLNSNVALILFLQLNKGKIRVLM